MTMRSELVLDVIDTHTEGEPTRILFWNSVPRNLKSASLMKEYFVKNFDYIRKIMLLEPRGHRDQFGAIVMPPVSQDADYTVLYITTDGYIDMCGHATIGLSTALVSMGTIKAEEPVTKIIYDTVAGKVEARVNVKNGEPLSVSVIDVESFYLGEKRIKVGEPVNAEVKVNLSYGGNFYAIVDGNEIGLDVDAGNIEKLLAAGMAIRASTFEQFRPFHPENDKSNTYPLAMITGTPKINHSNYRSVVIFSGGSFDRSPCGTGTASRGAYLYSKGLLKEGESFVHESINNTTFSCRIVSARKVGDRMVVVPEITGRAWITQISRIFVDPSDPLKHGFLVG